MAKILNLSLRRPLSCYFCSEYEWNSCASVLVGFFNAWWQGLAQTYAWNYTCLQHLVVVFVELMQASCVQEIELGHDGSGAGPSWHVDHVQVSWPCGQSCAQAYFLVDRYVACVWELYVSRYLVRCSTWHMAEHDVARGVVR